MKTRDEKNAVPSFDDLVFENRNKEYGAYKIRKKYDLTLIWAILVGVFCVSASVVTPFVIAPSKPITVQTSNDEPIVYEGTQLPVDVPKPEQPVPEVKIKPLVYLPPQVVDSLTNDNANELATNEELMDKVKNDSVNAPIAVVEKKIDIDPEPDNNKVVEIFSVSEKPSFGAGGENEFRSWIAENVKYPQLPLDNGIQGRVFVQFIVEKDGSISNVIVIRSVDPELDKEAVRVVSSSPKWNPGKQQGDPVRVRFTFPITFSLK